MLSCGKASCEAMNTPASRPTRAHIMVARTPQRIGSSSYRDGPSGILKKPCAFPKESKPAAVTQTITNAITPIMVAWAAIPLSAAVATITIDRTMINNQRPTRPSAASACINYSDRFFTALCGWTHNRIDLDQNSKNFAFQQGSAATSRIRSRSNIVTSDLPLVSMMPSSRSSVNCRLTVSMVSPKLSAISRRDIGRLSDTPSSFCFPMRSAIDVRKVATRSCAVLRPRSTDMSRD